MAYHPDLYRGPYKYDPKAKVDPFDTFSQVISHWLQHKSESRTGSRIIGGGADRRSADGRSEWAPLPFQCGNAEWESDFCQCLENGNIQSWYQHNSMFYVLHTCNAQEGLIMRNGHMQDRHTMPMQAMMACDVLKVFSFCWHATCPSAIRNWTQHCEEAHFSVPGCDVDCSSTPPQAGHSVLSIVLALVAALGAAMQLA